MLEDSVVSAAVERLRATIFGEHVEAFCARLAERGYRRASIRHKLWTVSALARWMADQGYAIIDLDEACVAGFLFVRRARGRTCRGMRHTGLALLEHLRVAGALPSPEAARDDSPFAAVLGQYTAYLRHERSVTEDTASEYVSIARTFVSERLEKAGARPDSLDIEDVRDFLLDRVHRVAPKRAQYLGSALRSFFRFLFARGEIRSDLALAVVTVRRRRAASVPRHMPARDVERLLRSCDRSSATGRRDFAILLLLARLGLRASEVRALELGDVRWREGEILIRGKGLIRDRLPLLPDVGKAIATYLKKDRPTSASRHVFLCRRAPYRPLGHPSSVSTIVMRAIVQAGLSPPTRGAHLLRHSLATAMVRRGASMAEIGQILRHRSPNTTELYAKLDFDALRGIALPWPTTRARCAMSALRESLEKYLSLRRGLGTELLSPGAYLHRFVEYLEEEGATVVTTELALRWATAPVDVTPATWTRRLEDVRRFAAWLSASDPRNEVPPPGLLPHRYRRRRPHIYSDKEIECILGAAAKLPSHSGLRAPTWVALFGLLATTGLRLGEAIGLDRDDVDLRAGVLAIRHAKFGTSRFVPIHDSTRVALGRYARQRDRLVAAPSSPAFFLSVRGVRVTQCTARYNFAVVSRAVGLRAPSERSRQGHGRGPRLHDMRHRLAVKTLIRWYREGRDVERELPRLATFLGHVHVADTYWYIEAVPELLELATERATDSAKDFP